VTATDANGRTVFESGAWDSAGRLSSGEAFQPHRTVIANTAEVQIFEVEMDDAQGTPTLSIIQAAGHRKDNRILPAGFSLERLKAAGFGDLAGQVSDRGTGPASGRARTTYRIPQTAVHVTAEALFQTIKPSHRPEGLSLAGKLAQPVMIGRVEVGL
jgi:hypothetical protein